MMTCADDSPAPAGEDFVHFGSFQLDRAKRALLREGKALLVGSRAIDILLALTERPGVIVSARELLRLVWSNTVVELGTIRVHVALLRKALRDAEPDCDYIQNVTGRGYRFVAPPAEQRALADAAGVQSSGSTVLRLPVRAPARRNNLPLLLTPVIGRAQAMRTLVARSAAQRLITITGAGGSGKTTVAISVANTLITAHTHGVCFVDLAAVTDPERVPGALASALGVASLAADPLPEVLALLSKQSMLIVLDNCEHVIEAAARLVESVLRNAPQVHVLATSREPLLANSELVHDLAPLEVPGTPHEHARAELLQFSAIQLFVERAGVEVDAELDDDDLLKIAAICRRLAGNPLAIEITAAQVRWLGVRSLAASLHNGVYLSIDGRRTAEPRHHTLRATFDWSYGLLTPAEQAVFRRASVFVGSFDLDSATAVMADDELTDAVIFGCLLSLARKSLVMADTSANKVLYRLLELPRAFAGEKLQQSDELAGTRRRYSQMWWGHIHAHARLWQVQGRAHSSRAPPRLTSVISGNSS